MNKWHSISRFLRQKGWSTASNIDSCSNWWWYLDLAKVRSVFGKKKKSSSEVCSSFESSGDIILFPSTTEPWLFFLLYYYPPLVKSSCQKCTRSIFWSRTRLFVWCTVTSSFSFPKSWFSFIRFFKNITATLCLKIMKLQRISIEPQCHKLMKSSMLKWMGGFSF